MARGAHGRDRTAFYTRAGSIGTDGFTVCMSASPARARPVLAAAILAACACREQPSEPAREPPPRASVRGIASSAPPSPSGTAGQPATAAPASSVARAVASAVVEARARLSIAAPRRTSSRIALGRGFAIQVRQDAVDVLSSTSGERLAEAPLAGARGAVALPGGSVLVAGLEASLRFDPNARVPHRMRRLGLLPDSALLANPQGPGAVWVAHLSRGTLLQYSLAADAGVLPDREIAAAEAEAVGVLRDGHVLFATSSGLVDVSPGGRRREMALPPEVTRPWRILAAHRLGQCWIVSEDGVLTLVDLTVRARPVRSFRIGAAPFEVATLHDRIVALTVSEPGVLPIQFSLRAFTFDGESLFTVSLPPASPTAEPDWAARLSDERHLAVAEGPPRIAIGGSGWIRLFDGRNGALVFTKGEKP